jgi:hypothetical protein
MILITFDFLMREHSVEVFLILAVSIHSICIVYQKKNKDSVKNTSLYIKMVLRFYIKKEAV